MKKLNNTDVINRLINVHGYRYDYSKVNYIGSRNKIIIICSEHGEFEQEYRHHVSGNNCPKCANKLYNLLFKKSKFDLINKFIELHGNKYDYSMVDYINNKKKITIICPEHGKFNQRAGSHLEGYGCPTCKESMGERYIRLFLEHHNIKFISQHKFDDCKNIRPLPFDFYLPDYNTCIEYNGKQHYELNHFFLTNESFNDLKHRDNIKHDYCINNGINLIIIKYDDNITDRLINLIW